MKRTFISAASGIAWGVFGYWLVDDTNLAGGAWVGLAAAPFIGLGIGTWAIRAKPLGLLGRVLFALLSLYLAVGLFAAAVGIWQVTLGWGALPELQSDGRWWAFVSSVAGALYGFTLTGWVLLLWPLSVANHFVIWARATDFEARAAG